MQKLHLTKTKVKNLKKDIETDRNLYIGGSDVGTIMGFNQYKSSYTLWAEKTGLIEPEDISDKDAVWLGTMTEEINGKWFKQKTGKKIMRSKIAYGVKEYPYLRGHVDFLVRGESAGLECKFTGFNRYNYESGEVPPSHFAQVQFYMLVTGRKQWYLSTIQANHYHINVIDRDEEFIEQMLDACEDFWNHVQNNVPPEIDGSESTTDTIASMYPSSEEGEVIDLNKFEGELIALQELASQKKNLDELSDKYKNEIKEFMKTAERGETSQFYVSWKTDKRGARRFSFKEKPV